MLVAQYCTVKIIGSACALIVADLGILCTIGVIAHMYACLV